MDALQSLVSEVLLLPCGEAERKEVEKEVLALYNDWDSICHQVRRREERSGQKEGEVGTEGGEVGTEGRRGRDRRRRGRDGGKERSRWREREHFVCCMCTSVVVCVS